MLGALVGPAPGQPQCYAWREDRHSGYRPALCKTATSAQSPFLAQAKSPWTQGPPFSAFEKHPVWVDFHRAGTMSKGRCLIDGDELSILICEGGDRLHASRP